MTLQKRLYFCSYQSTFKIKFTEVSCSCPSFRRFLLRATTLGLTSPHQESHSTTTRMLMKHSIYKIINCSNLGGQPLFLTLGMTRCTETSWLASSANCSPDSYRKEPLFTMLYKKQTNFTSLWMELSISDLNWTKKLSIAWDSKKDVLWELSTVLSIRRPSTVTRSNMT